MFQGLRFLGRYGFGLLILAWRVFRMTLTLSFGLWFFELNEVGVDFILRLGLRILSGTSFQAEVYRSLYALVDDATAFGVSQ